MPAQRMSGDGAAPQVGIPDARDEQPAIDRHSGLVLYLLPRK